MKFKKTDFKDLVIIKHNIFRDHRGYFKEIIKLNELENFILQKINFCQENSVKSKKNVLRGLHFQNEPHAQSKLVSIISGSILDIAVDIRKNSKTYGKYFSYILDSKNHESLFIPRGFAHGYLTLSNSATIDYHVDNYYNSKAEDGIHYEDHFINIDWGIHKSKIIISEKDKNIKPFKW